LVLAECGRSSLGDWGGSWLVREQIKEVLGGIAWSIVEDFLLTSTEFLSKRRGDKAVGKTGR
jgi:hypothetical protein